MYNINNGAKKSKSLKSKTNHKCETPPKNHLSHPPINYILFVRAADANPALDPQTTERSDLVLGSHIAIAGLKALLGGSRAPGNASAPLPSAMGGTV
jgi:hypothetical protein